eukprot:510682-Alexandrium_andersonii.AAC.1
MGSAFREDCLGADIQRAAQCCMVWLQKQSDYLEEKLEKEENLDRKDHQQKWREWLLDSAR